ncbi:MAG: hypothetical protein GX829_10730 [Clostridium sp.]|nr:hypothetical protein [Clostridium sp.]
MSYEAHECVAEKYYRCLALTLRILSELKIDIKLTSGQEFMIKEIVD